MFQLFGAPVIENEHSVRIFDRVQVLRVVDLVGVIRASTRTYTMGAVANSISGQMRSGSRTAAVRLARLTRQRLWRGSLSVATPCLEVRLDVGVSVRGPLRSAEV